MKLVSPIDYINRAVSTDHSRYTMTAPWRQDSWLCATDGHRLHWISGMALAPTAYIDGRDATPPSIDSVIPATAPDVAVTIKPSRELLKELKTLSKLQRAQHSPAIICIIDIRDGRLSLRSTAAQPTRWSIADCGTYEVANNEPTSCVGVNLSYLLDTLIEGVPCELRYLRSGDGVTLIQVSYEHPNYQDFNAIIMPVRLDAQDR
jgi:hypothetical protein